MIHSFLMIGQSNMAGRGFLTDVELITDERLHMMRNGRWRPLTEPVNFDRPTAGICPATSFVYRYIQENAGVEAALIPCADGGTGIDDWLKGMPLYENALFCTRMAMKASTLAGILWHQGEHDSCEELIGDYEEKFLQFYHDLMADIGVDVPFLIGGVPLAEYSDDPEKRHYAAILNEKLRAIAEKSPISISYPPRASSATPITCTSRLPLSASLVSGITKCLQPGRTCRMKILLFKKNIEYTRRCHYEAQSLIPHQRRYFPLSGMAHHHQGLWRQSVCRRFRPPAEPHLPLR